jgi:hypothetical protein
MERFDAILAQGDSAEMILWSPLEWSLASLPQMRTLAAGVRALRRAPLAVAPLTVEGLIAAALIVNRNFPASGVSAPAAAVFPLDVYFDLKQALTHAHAWPWFIVAMALSVTLRTLALTLTLCLAGGDRASFGRTLVRVGRLAALAALVLLPAAIFLFVGVGARYAPFIWVGAILGAVPAFLLVRTVTRWDGPGRAARAVPRASGFLAYVYLLAAVATAMTLSSRYGVWPPALLLALSAPMHALFLVGWREHSRAGTRPGGTAWAWVITVAVVAIVFGSAGIDRFVRDGGPPAPPVAGTLALLGGINSTTSTGALSALDPRRLGFSPARTRVLSYRRGGSYGEAATHGNLDVVAPVVSSQLGRLQRPIDLVGHSQAALILDRLLKMHLDAPDRAVLLSAPPPYPPSVTVPPSGQTGAGAVAADIARPLSRVFELFGANGFNLDAAAAPFHLKRVVVGGAPIPRVAVWALGDSVWLEGDWRRPGEINVVAITDHVGMTNDPRALSTARTFFENKRVRPEGASWRGFAVNVLRYAFEPWKPR